MLHFYLARSDRAWNFGGPGPEHLDHLRPVLRRVRIPLPVQPKATCTLNSPQLLRSEFSLLPFLVLELQACFDTGCIEVQEVTEKNLGLELQLVTGISHGDC